MTTPTNSPAALLVAGHWLGAWAWDDLLPHLPTERLHAVPITLPGLDPQDPQRTERTLDDQANALVAAITAEHARTSMPVTVVGHSGANAPVAIAVDRVPHLVASVVWVDSGPVADGTCFAPGLPESVTELPLPHLEELGQQASLNGLDAEALATFVERAVAQPAAVLRGTVRLSDPARFEVPTTLICSSMTGEQAMEMARGGHPMFAEVASYTNVRAVDLTTGHWPMWSRPAELAALILAAVEGPHAKE